MKNKKLNIKFTLINSGLLLFWRHQWYQTQLVMLWNHNKLLHEIFWLSNTYEIISTSSRLRTEHLKLDTFEYIWKCFHLIRQNLVLLLMPVMWHKMRPPLTQQKANTYQVCKYFCKNKLCSASKQLLRKALIRIL